MLFNSWDYLVFLTTVVALYWPLPSDRGRVWLLLAASFTFYATWNLQLAFLVVTTTVGDYVIARLIDFTAVPRRKKALFLCSLGMNLSVLAYFKYVNFFLESLREALTAAGAQASIPFLEVMVPFGISFYTFEAISYTMDVYRGRIAAEKSLPNFALFILFFPHLVAGPIVRAYDYLPQVSRPKRFSWLRFQRGLELLLLGFFMKAVMADRFAMFASPMFKQPELFKSTAVWLGLFAQSLRIYCDFAGYSMMALGSAHLLGYKLTINFRRPYFSKNVSEFWRRWHISLSTWLRDYLFIPLGGSRGTRYETCRNLMIVMALGGLWHGADWGYVVWGIYHGALLVTHRYCRDYIETKPRLAAMLRTTLGTLFRVALTFLFVMIGWAFFQPSLDNSVTMLQRMFVHESGLNLKLPNQSLWILFALLLTGSLVGEFGRWDRFSRRANPILLGGAYGAMFVASLLLSPDESHTFIYFTF